MKAWGSDCTLGTGKDKPDGTKDILSKQREIHSWPIQFLGIQGVLEGGSGGRARPSQAYTFEAET